MVASPHSDSASGSHGGDVVNVPGVANEHAGFVDAVVINPDVGAPRADIHVGRQQRLLDLAREPVEPFEQVFAGVTDGVVRDTANPAESLHADRATALAMRAGAGVQHDDRFLRVHSLPKTAHPRNLWRFP